MSDLRSNLLRPVGLKTLVTGATGDFGKSVIKSLHEDGHQVVAIGRNPEKLLSIKEVCTKIITLDINDTAALKNEIKNLDNIDNIILCHGINGPRPMRMLSYDFIDKVIKTNLYSTLDLLSNLLRGNKINKPGRIINCSSISAYMGAANNIPYAASKAGLDAALRGLARDLLKKNITVNSIAPAAIDTSLFEGNKPSVLNPENYPLGMGELKDIVNAVKFLLLEGSKYITGETIIMNGGNTWLD